MTHRPVAGGVARRSVITATAAAGFAQLASPFIIAARGETPLRIGMIDPLTGAYAALARNEVVGARLAAERLNAAGGLLGRQIELLVEDSANDVGTGVQKARKLIDRDHVDFLIGDVNSAIALAIAQVSNEKGVLHIVSGGHTDPITGKDCKWNVFRVCGTTRMDSNAIAPLLVRKYGKRWYFITPDYAYGHTLQAGMQANLAKLGGSVAGGALTPIGTTDFSAFLIQARAAHPDVLILLVGGQDAVNCLKQVVQFGIERQIHVAGALQELENLEGLPPQARIGTWLFEWYWKQPDVPDVAAFVADIRKVNGGRVPTARHWFGFTSVMTLGLVAAQAKTTNGLALARALAGFALPPEVRLQPGNVFYRAGDHQLMISSYIGRARAHGAADPDDLFEVDDVVPGEKVAQPVADTGCSISWPS